jgi:CheY-like chemotaxis protein
MCSGPIPGGRVLIVDDDEDIRKILVRFLQPVVTEVVEAGNGQDALKLVRASAFSVILTDLGLPDISGVRLIREIRQVDAHVRMVILSGSAQRLAPDEFADLQVDGLLSKPIGMQQLLGEVGRLVAAGPRP